MAQAQGSAAVNRLAESSGAGRIRASGYEKGGMPTRIKGLVKGPKGKDVIPAWLSRDEYVLPEDTVEAVGGASALDRLVESTTGKKPGGKPVKRDNAVFEGGASGRMVAGLAQGGRIHDSIPEREAVKRPAPLLGDGMVRNAESDLRGRHLRMRQEENKALGISSERSAVKRPAPMGYVAGGSAQARMSSFDGAEAARKRFVRNPNLRTVQPTAQPAANPASVGGAPAAAPGPSAPVKARPGKIKGGIAGAAAIGAMTGAYDSIKDLDTGYREEFNKSIGSDGNSGLMSADADLLRVAGNVGNAITGGYAGRVGQGLSSKLSGGTFSEGFNEPTHRDRFMARMEQPAKAPQPAADNRDIPTSQEAPISTGPTKAMDDAFDANAFERDMGQRSAGKSKPPSDDETYEALRDDMGSAIDRGLPPAGADGSDARNSLTERGNAGLRALASDQGLRSRMNDQYQRDNLGVQASTDAQGRMVFSDAPRDAGRATTQRAISSGGDMGAVNRSMARANAIRGGAGGAEGRLSGPRGGAIGGTEAEARDRSDFFTRSALGVNLLRTPSGQGRRATEARQRAVDAMASFGLGLEERNLKRSALDAAASRHEGEQSVEREKLQVDRDRIAAQTEGLGARNRLAELSVTQQQRIDALQDRVINPRSEDDAQRAIQQLNALLGRKDDEATNLMVVNQPTGELDISDKPIMVPTLVDRRTGRIVKPWSDEQGQTQGAPSAQQQFEEGKTYVDANGNKAVYRNGQWQEVK